MTRVRLTQAQIDEAIDLALTEPLTSLDEIGARYGVTGEAITWNLKKRGIAHRPRPTMAQRFWVRVDSSAGPDACWPWTGPLNVWGYGAFCHARRSEAASRTAWRLAHGRDIPSGLVVMHTCDNPPCCNPAHLRLGTHADNAHDRDAKGRQVAPRGEAQGSARLTAEQVRAIRETYDRGEANQYQLAAAYAVTQGTISRIVRRAGWTHVPETLDSMTAAKWEADRWSA